MTPVKCPELTKVNFVSQDAKHLVHLKHGVASFRVSICFCIPSPFQCYESQILQRLKRLAAGVRYASRPAPLVKRMVDAVAWRSYDTYHCAG
jgi:hypothetical protein